MLVQPKLLDIEWATLRTWARQISHDPVSSTETVADAKALVSVLDAYHLTRHRHPQLSANLWASAKQMAAALEETA